MYGIYYLSHGGPGSGRYPLGSGERPYQGRGGFGGRRRHRKYTREERMRIEKERHDADKERVLKSGTASEVRKYRGELSNKELQEVYSRLNMEKKIKDMSLEDTVSAQSTFNKVANNVKNVTEWVAIGILAYNTAVTIYNTTPKGSQSPAKVIKKG